MKLAYVNEEELEDEGDDIAYQNDEHLNLNAEQSDSSDEDEDVKKPKAAAGQKRKRGGLARYATESKKFDMSDVDNHFRYL